METETFWPSTQWGVQALLAQGKKAEALKLADLAGTNPGLEGKWFAAAKDAGFLDFAGKDAEFAITVGMLAIDGFVNGLGFEVTGADVAMACSGAMQAGTRLGRSADVRRRVAEMLRNNGVGAAFVGRALGGDGAEGGGDTSATASSAARTDQGA